MSIKLDMIGSFGEDEMCTKFVSCSYQNTMLCNAMLFFAWSQCVIFLSDVSASTFIFLWLSVCMDDLLMLLLSDYVVWRKLWFFQAFISWNCLIVFILFSFFLTDILFFYF